VSRLIRAVIDTPALRANLSRIRSVAPRSRVIAVIKANAYGHGLVPVARALSGGDAGGSADANGSADAFAVARLDEAITLREAGIEQPIVLLEGVHADDALAEAAAQRLELVVHHAGQIEMLERWRGAHRFVAWAKLDTGMNRLGFREAEWPRALERLRALPVPLAHLRVMTHLANADDQDSAFTLEQLARFRRATQGLGLAASVGNSAGLFGWADARTEWVRPGIALYGATPFRGATAASLGLTPVMTLETTVIAMRDVPRGESVGYGSVWRAPRDSRVAILAAGYGDGLLRSAANGTPVIVNGARASLVGRASMDMIAADVTDLPPVAVGSRAQLWGRELPVDEVAARAGTIAYELLTAVRARVAYEFR
jgi:alanine racemase